MRPFKSFENVPVLRSKDSFFALAAVPCCAMPWQKLKESLMFVFDDKGEFFEKVLIA